VTSDGADGFGALTSPLKSNGLSNDKYYQASDFYNITNLKIQLVR